MVKFERADAGGVVFVNPESVVCVVAHDTSNKVTEIVYNVQTSKSVAVVFGSPSEIVRQLSLAKK